MRQLDYQDKVLGALDRYLSHLRQEKARCAQVAKIALEQPTLNIPVPDFTSEAWTRCSGDADLPMPAWRKATPYSPRRDGTGAPVPSITLKVPTGGGKTYLAVQALSRIFGSYLSRNTGFVLWVVPSDAIYTQTIKHLRDRAHPYRQALEKAAAGRVLILEKNDTLHRADVDANLCVMVLMLQAAGRETKDQLKLFRDRGDVHGFVPSDGEQERHRELLQAVPNLDAYDADGYFTQVKASLGNALRLVRPVLVMDEAHKFTSDLAFKTMLGFNPGFMLELSATPKDIARNGQTVRHYNLLVEVTGKEVDREGMIKMPINVSASPGHDWKGALNTAVNRLRSLRTDADKLHSNSHRYIRPILLVQVERTGKDQRDGIVVHADDANDYLLGLGYTNDHIAIKTAQVNELEDEELLSDKSTIQIIITKQALQEGWDCSFAYVLCSLAQQTSLTALTQLVGRILRQPDATKTGIASLDQSYVVALHDDTHAVLQSVKNGLESDGLGDLAGGVVAADGSTAQGVTRKQVRRAPFEKADIYLPKVMYAGGDHVRDLDYESDVLAHVDWRGCDVAGIAAEIPDNAEAEANLLATIGYAAGPGTFATSTESAGLSGLAFDMAFACRSIADIVPNPFVAREIVGNVTDRLKARGFDDERLGGLSALIIDRLRRGLDAKRDVMAEAVFRAAVADKRIQFRLRLDARLNWQMPFEMIESFSSEPHFLHDQTGAAVKKSLFAPFFENNLNNEEKAVAIQLDGQGALRWWHRNVARQQYALQGWKRGRIYPDFIFAIDRKGAAPKIAILETKGEHLDNLDTGYKRKVMDLMSDSFGWDSAIPAGTLNIGHTGEEVECRLILMGDIPTRLPQMLS